MESRGEGTQIFVLNTMWKALCIITWLDGRRGGHQKWKRTSYRHLFSFNTPFFTVTAIQLFSLYYFCILFRRYLESNLIDLLTICILKHDSWHNWPKIRITPREKISDIPIRNMSSFSSFWVIKLRPPFPLSNRDKI